MNETQRFLQEQMKKAEHSIQILEEGREKIYEYIVENGLDEACFEEKLIMLNQSIDRLKDQYKQLGDLAEQAANTMSNLVSKLE